MKNRMEAIVQAAHLADGQIRERTIRHELQLLVLELVKEKCKECTNKGETCKPFTESS